MKLAGDGHMAGFYRIQGEFAPCQPVAAPDAWLPPQGRRRPWCGASCVGHGGSFPDLAPIQSRDTLSESARLAISYCL